MCIHVLKVQVDASKFGIFPSKDKPENQTCILEMTGTKVNTM